MLEPQSTAVFLLLMLAFCALLAWVALSRQVVFRVLAASLAFIPAMLFGVAAVNKYYDYYQTWSAIAADFGVQGLSSARTISAQASGSHLNAILGKVTPGDLPAQEGETIRLTLPGRLSHVSRLAYMYLPPQYFQKAYQHYRFPAIELITGFPGEPQDWINVVGIVHTFQTLLQDGLAKPAVLVMPDANGGPRISLQCLNVVHGPQDATFLAVDVPDYLSQKFRVQPPGRAWGIAGYSEGGYCAANLSLLYPARFGFAGVLSGYFRPFRDMLGNPPRAVAPFGKNVALRRKNTPLVRVNVLPVYIHIPKFWLGAGSQDSQDVRAAVNFQRLLLARQPSAHLHLAPGGGHDMATWRALVPPMLQWMTPLLARRAQQSTASTAAGPVTPNPAASGPATASLSPAPSPRPSLRSPG